MKSQKGYSLIEIAIGIAILTIFLVFTGSLVNASFDNYRLILQRSEALEFAMREMENVLKSDDVEISDTGYTENYMTTRVKIDNVKDGNKVYDDKVFLVTVTVNYYKTPKSTEKYSIELQSLKVVR